MTFAGLAFMILSVGSVTVLFAWCLVRVLRSGGRLAVSDVVATAVLPADVRADWGAYTGCMAGASLITDLERMLQDAGFVSVRIEPKDSSRSFIRQWLPGSRVEDFLLSAAISAVKP